MQPISTLPRPGGMPWTRHLVRATMAIAIASAAATVPISQVAACSCGFGGFDEVIAAADVAFVGTVVGESEPPLGGVEPARYTFDVSLSKVPMPSPFEMDSTFGNGANCGFDMAIGEEWLIIASAWEGRLETNLCTGSTLTGQLDPGELARIEGAMSPNDSAAVPEEQWSPLDIPAPVIGILAATLLIAVAGFLAFRGRSSRAD